MKEIKGSKIQHGTWLLSVAVKKYFVFGFLAALKGVLEYMPPRPRT